MEEIRPNLTKLNQWQKVVERKVDYDDYDNPTVIEPPQYKTYWLYILSVNPGMPGYSPMICSLAISEREVRLNGGSFENLPFEFIKTKFATGFYCLYQYVQHNYKK